MEQHRAATTAPVRADLAIVGGTMVPCGEEAPTEMTLLVTDGIVSGLVAPGVPVDATRTIDASGCAVLAGFVNCHTHIASNLLLRGLLEDTELFGWLQTMWKLKQNFDHETLYWASMCGLVEMARSGITCFNEHFDGYAVTPEVRALDEVGLRATLGYGFADAGVYAPVADWSWAALADFDAATIGAADIDGDRIRLALSPHAPYSCSEAM